MQCRPIIERCCSCMCCEADSVQSLCQRTLKIELRLQIINLENAICGGCGGLHNNGKYSTRNGDQIHLSYHLATMIVRSGIQNVNDLSQIEESHSLFCLLGWVDMAQLQCSCNTEVLLQHLSVAPILKQACVACLPRSLGEFLKMGLRAAKIK